MVGSVRSIVGASSLSAVALLLSGCGGSGGGGSTITTTTPAAGPKRTTVLVMRHCNRGMFEDGIYENPNLVYFNNYSAAPWPPFNVPGMDCTANGAEIIKKQGLWYRNNNPLPTPVNVIADDCERDNVTGHMLMEGLGIRVTADNFVVNGEPFQWDKIAPACQISTQRTIEILKSQMERFPMPANFASQMDKVFSVAGDGAAGDWRNLTCEPCDATAIEAHYWAPLCGGCQVADSFMQRFMMEWGALQEVGWGGLSTEEIPELMAIHSWYIGVTLNSPEENSIKAASIAWGILDALEAASEGTTAFIGHDLQLGGLSGALGLSWMPSPWPTNNTTPGSGIRFDLDGDNVEVNYIWVNNFTSVEVKTVPVTFPEQISSTPGVVSMTKLRELVQDNTVEACASWRFGPSTEAPSPAAAAELVL